MSRFARSIYSQFLYWFALRLQVRHPVVLERGREHLYDPNEYTWWERYKIGLNARLMARSNAITFEYARKDAAKFKKENTLRLVLRGVSHDPHRKDPEGSVL